MIKGNIIYKVKCPHCSKYREIKYKNDMDSDVKIFCSYCKEGFMLEKNIIKNKWYDKYISLQWNLRIFIGVVLGVLGIIVLIWLIVFWVLEFREGRIWGIVP